MTHGDTPQFRKVSRIRRILRHLYYTSRRLTLNVAMSAWLAASIYDGVTAEQFLRSNLHFTLLPNGAVKFDRIAAGKE